MISNLNQHLTHLVKNQFTGILLIKSPTRIEWQIYLFHGRLTWVTDNQQPLRRLRRYLNQHGQIKNLAFLQTVSNCDSQDYHLLLKLIQHKKLTNSQAEIIIQEIITEVLFDILWEEDKITLMYSHNSEQLSPSVKFPLKLFSYQTIWFKVNQQWSDWLFHKLNQISPNSILVLSHYNPKINHKNLANIKAIANGQNTIREMAALMKHDIIKIIKYLKPFIESGFIIETDPHSSNTVELPKPSQNTDQQYRIACIDDSLLNSQFIQKIILASGHEFIHIENPVYALPTLIKEKPDLIFLDIMMPIVNGQELCTQIRRISTFKDTPIIIISGSSNLLTKLKSKANGASDFLVKPLQPQQILEVITKYLQSQPLLMASELA